jgi:hypothetical protein
MRFLHRKHIVLAAALVAASGCDLFTGPKLRLRVKPELLRVETTTLAGALAPALAATLGVDPTAVTSSAFDIQSLRMPIRAIEMSSSTDPKAHISIYNCAADTNDGCLVELVGPALQDMLSTDPIPVNPGSFDRITVGLCRNESTHTAYMRGTVVLGGTLYYTKANGTLSATAPAEHAPVSWTGCALAADLMETIVIAKPDQEPGGPEIGPDDMVIPVRVYYDLEDVAWGATAATWANWFPAGCSVPLAQAESGTPFFCLTYPNVTGTVDTGHPILERYRVGSSITVGLFFSVSTDKPLSGQARSHFQESAPFEPLIGSSLFRNIVAQPDGSYRLEGWPVNGSPSPLFPAFRRETHSGTVVDAGVVKQYTAVRLP